MRVRLLPRVPFFPACIVSSRRPGSEPGGRRCNSCHPDHFGWLAEQQCPGPENRVSLQAAWVQFLHHPPISYASCSSKAERPPDKRKTAERYRAGRPFDNQKTERTSMKIAKALKLKNQLAGYVAQLKELLVKQNVRSTKQKFDYENREVLTRLRAKLDELIKVKAAVAVANAEIYDKIFRLAELKGLVATLTSLDTKAGVFHEGGRFGEPGYEVEYVAQLGKVDVDKLVPELQDEIQTLQDALDEFNFTRSVNA